MSVVEQTLREDPAGVYGAMDFATRDRYRHVVERLAQRSARSRRPRSRAPRSSWRASAARAAARRPRGARRLLPGRRRAARSSKRAVGMRAAVARRAARDGRRASPLLLYLGAIAADHAAFAAACCWRMRRRRGSTAGCWRWPAAGRCSPPASSRRAGELAGDAAGDAAAAAAHGFLARASRRSRARWSWCRRCSASAADVDELVEALEVRFLANRDAHLHFGLLTDFRDARRRRRCRRTRRCCDARARRHRSAQPQVPQRGERPLLPVPSAAPLESARARLDGLRAQARQAADLNALLRGGGQRPLLAASSATPRVLPDVQLRDHARHRHAAAARRRARSSSATMAHPLNRPRYDERSGASSAATASCSRAWASACRREPLALRAAVRQRAGHRSRTRAPSPTSTRTCSAKARSSARASTTSMRSSARSTGASPRTASSATTCSKAATRARACSATCSCTRSIPSRYGADVSRRHRWIRGDWQIAALAAAARAAAPAAHAQRNPLSALSRWKILDNLRRSLVPPALTLLLLLGWIVLPHAAGSGRWRCSAIVLLPPARRSLLDLLRKPADVRAGASTCARPARRPRGSFAQAAFTLACLPYEAFFSLDAIVRTLWRMLVTRRRLLEWKPVERRRAQRAATALRGVLPRDVDRAGRSRSRGAALALLQPGRAARSPRRCCCCGSRRRCDRLVAEPAARAPRGAS